MLRHRWPLALGGAQIALIRNAGRPDLLQLRSAQIGGYACATVIGAATAGCCSPIVSPPAA